VLSNSPASATRWILSSADSSVSRVTFQPTPPMSTYLLSIAVGHLQSATSHTTRQVSQLAWHPLIFPTAGLYACVACCPLTSGCVAQQRPPSVASYPLYSSRGHCWQVTCPAPIVRLGLLAAVARLCRSGRHLTQ
jgi:hypothetical protein